MSSPARAARPLGPALLALGLGAWSAGCDRAPIAKPAAASPGPAVSTVAARALSGGGSEAPAGPAPIRFAEVREDSGIDFEHRSGYDAEKYFPTSLGSGLAVFDYDGDGRMDLYFAATRSLPLDRPDPKSRGNRLYRNLGGWRFEDVTERSGAGFDGFCQGACVGDFDDDSHPDLFLTNLGPNVLLLNNGDGTFRDATAGSGLEGPIWSSGAAPLDYDGDGQTDLYVSCYTDWTLATHAPCYGDVKRSVRILCSPFAMKSARHYLYRNRGDGTFEDATATAGVLRTDGRGLGVVAADVNRDGRPDLYVANDGCPNFLFLNRGDGTFDDASRSSGADTDASGQVQGSMGVDAEDLTGDGLPELFTTNFRGQYNTLYLNLDGQLFQDASRRAGIVPDSQLWVGWGCALADFDNDGQPDMFVVNGEVDDNLSALGLDIPFAEPAFVWRGLGGGRFATVRGAGPFFDESTHAARGAGFGDLDDDGDLDAVVTVMDGPPRLLRNDSPGRPWIRFALKGGRSGRDAIGARVEVRLADGRTITRLMKGGGSYLGSNDPRILIGLGEGATVESATITWPSGAVTTLEAPAIGQTHESTEPPA